MLDPAALGTLLIGLEAVRADAEDHGPRPSLRARHPRRVKLRRAMANGLRRLAALLEPPPVAEAAN